MKTLLIPQYFYPTYGGLQHFTCRISNELTKHDVAVTILSPPPEPDRDVFWNLRPDSRVQWDIIGRTRAEFWKLLPSVWRNPFDAVLFLSIEYEDLIEPQLMCMQAAIKISKRTFARIAAVGDYPAVITSHVEREAVIRGLSGVIVPTAFMANEVRTSSEGNVLPKVIPNLIDFAKYHRVSDSKKVRLRKQLGLPAGPLAMWAGRFDETKNLSELLLAWHDAQDEGHLILVGDDPYASRTYRTFLVSVVRSNSIRNVIFYGHCSEPIMPSLYQACDVYLCTSVKEGHSNASIEAGACGLPIIAFDVPGVSETAQSFPNVWNRLVKPGDIAELSLAIEDVLAEASTGRGLGNDACALHNRHTPDFVVAEYMDVLFGAHAR